MNRIPKILHFCFGFKEGFGGKPWGLAHHVSVRSAIERIKPDVAYLYYEYLPEGPWWEATLKLVEPVRITAPREIFGNPVSHPAHRADVVRLQKLIEHGGIYLDCDVLVQRSFDDLLDNSVVMGLEGRGIAVGMANAIILSEPQAPFLIRWFEMYRSFRGSGQNHWNEHSVRLPNQLARRHPDEIKILPYDAFFWPTWRESHIRWIFASTKPIDLSNTYANHFWEQKAWPYICDLTPGEVRRIDTNFHQWVRPFVADLPDDYGAPSECHGRRGPRGPELIWNHAKMYAQMARDTFREVLSR